MRKVREVAFVLVLKPKGKTATVVCQPYFAQRLHRSRVGRLFVAKGYTTEFKACIIYRTSFWSHEVNPATGRPFAIRGIKQWLFGHHSLFDLLSLRIEVRRFCVPYNMPALAQDCPAGLDTLADSPPRWMRRRETSRKVQLHKIECEPISCA